MKSVDNEIKNYRTRFRFTKHFIKSNNCIVTKDYSNSPSPISFLEQLSIDEEKSNSIVEEIFKQEKSRFCDRFLESYTASPTKTPARLETSFTEPPKKNKNSSLLPKRNLDPFPRILSNYPQKKNSITTSKTHKKLEKFVKECNDIHKTITENSNRFNLIMNKERKIAKNYSKNFQWTSKKLLEINGYTSDIIKALYEEHKTFNDSYEREKKTLSKCYNTRTLDDYKRKVKHIKTLLVTYKNKVIP